MTVALDAGAALPTSLAVGVGSREPTGLNSPAAVARAAADGPDDAVVVADHRELPARQLRRRVDVEDDGVAALVDERRLDLDQRARQRQRIPRRGDVLAQVVAVVGAGQREVRPERAVRPR